MSRLWVLVLALCITACADAIPEPVTGRTAMLLPSGRYGWAVWCRGGQARCWWEASRVCGTDGYRVYDQTTNRWTETTGVAVVGQRGYVQQSRHNDGSMLIECGPFSFAKPLPKPTAVPVTPTATATATVIVPDTGQDFRREVPF